MSNLHASIDESNADSFRQYIKQVGRDRKNMHAIVVDLAQSDFFSRSERNMHIAMSQLTSLASMLRIRTFQIPGRAFVIIFRQSKQDLVDNILKRVNQTLQSLGGQASERVADVDSVASESEIVHYYNLENDYEDFLFEAMEVVAEAPKSEKSKRESEVKKPSERQKNENLEPLTTRNLHQLERAIENADMSNYVRYQPICTADENLRFNPIAFEIFISIEQLRQDFFPNVDIFASSGLFRHLTVSLDRRILNFLKNNYFESRTRNININMNIETVLSQDFEKFNDNLAITKHGTIVTELQTSDIMSHFADLQDAVAYLRHCGYRILADGIFPDTMGLVNYDELNLDLFKVFAMKAHLPRFNEQTVADQIKRMGPRRIIFGRCDTKEAVMLGREMGVMMFQGNYVDSALRRAPRR